MESILETKTSTILEFLAGLRGSLFVTFEEGTWAAWLYDLLKPHVTEVLVCNPRKIPLLKRGNKSDKMDARKLAERLRLHDLKPVYHGENGLPMLRQLARSGGHRVLISSPAENFTRIAIDKHEQLSKARHPYYYDRLWSPQRPTVVYVGSAAFGLAIIEMSENVELRL